MYNVEFVKCIQPVYIDQVYDISISIKIKYVVSFIIFIL